MRSIPRHARGKYSGHKSNAKARGIEFLLTLEQWLGIWQASGKWQDRGSNQGQYCMCRRGDKGPYSESNVYIATNRTNTRQALARRWRKQKSMKSELIALGE